MLGSSPAEMWTPGDSTPHLPSGVETSADHHAISQGDPGRVRRCRQYRVASSQSWCRSPVSLQGKADNERNEVRGSLSVDATVDPRERRVGDSHRCNLQDLLTNGKPRF